MQWGFIPMSVIKGMGEATPPVCNKFVAPDCEPFPSCRYPVDNLSGVNKRELVCILNYFHDRYKQQPAAHWRRKIHAMQKVLDHFGLRDNASRDSGVDNG